MNTRKRLERLETGSTHSTDLVVMVRDNLSALLPLFIQTEQVFWPHRASLRSGKVSVAVEERRRLYRSGGVAWSGPGGSSTNWKRSERQRALMVQAGLITMASTGGVPLVKLTDSALATMRALIGAPQLDRGSKLLRVAAAVLYDQANPYCRVGGWISETLLSGKTYEDLPTTSQWYDFESLVLPLLVAGAMESHSSTIGCIYYRVAGQEPVYPDVPDISVDPEVQEKYLAAWSLDVRSSWQPTDLSEVVQSLSATV